METTVVTCREVRQSYCYDSEYIHFFDFPNEWADLPSQEDRSFWRAFGFRMNDMQWNG